MTRQQRKIAFQKWRSPYSEGEPEEFWMGETEEEADFDLTDDWSAVTTETEEKKTPKRRMYMYTPFGPVPVTVNHEAVFNFWEGHTNFSITHGIKERLDKIPGIETLDILTRYRFRFGVAKAFRPANVMANITQKLGAVPMKIEPYDNTKKSE